MVEPFGFYVDNLVTKEYLDVRLAEQEKHFDEKLALLRIKLGQHSLMHVATFTAVVIPLVRDLLA